MFNYTSVTAEEEMDFPKSSGCINSKLIYQSCGNIVIRDLNCVQDKKG